MNSPFLSFRKHRFKLLVIAALLVSVLAGVYVLSQILSWNEVSFPRQPGYKYEQIASFDVKSLISLGIKSASTYSGIWRGSESAYNLTEVTVSYSGNFSLGDTVTDYSLYSHASNSDYHSSRAQRVYYTLFIIFFTRSPSDCELSSPGSSINCSEILLIDLNDPQTSLHRDILVPPYQPSKRFVMLNDTEVPDLLDSHLTLILGTYQG